MKNSLTRYMKFVWPYRRNVVLLNGLGILKLGFPLLIPLALKVIVDDILVQKLSMEEKMVQLAWIIGGLAILFAVIRVPLEYGYGYYVQKLADQVVFNIRRKLYLHIQKLSPYFYSNSRTGDTVSRIMNDVERTQSLILTGLFGIGSNVLVIVLSIVIMFTLNTTLTLVALCILPFYVWIGRLFYPRLQVLSKEFYEAMADLQSHLQEQIQGMSTIQSFAREKQQLKTLERKSEHVFEQGMKYSIFSGKYHISVQAVADLGPILFIGVAGLLVIQQDITVGSMIAFLVLLDRLFSPVSGLVHSFTTITETVVAIDRVFELLDQPVDIQDKEDSIAMKEVKRALEFCDVEFTYPEREHAVLKKLSFTIKKGETVAVVGRSGSGKSTLIQLIQRFFDPEQGRILIDGIDVQEYSLFSLRNQIGQVFQETFIFSGTIKDNIQLGDPHASEDEVIRAAISAQAHDFIMQLPKGYDTEVGERGANLSGGQRQRIGLARLFLKNPSVMLLDEATSALDLETEAKVYGELKKAAGEKTLLIVAHRLSSVQDADQIILLQHGEIKEQGTHEQLMGLRGRYFDLYQLQEEGKRSRKKGLLQLL